MDKSQRYLDQWRDTDRRFYVPLAKYHLEFLDEVAKYPSLVNGEHLKNAIRRYELFWLPLCKKHGTMSSEDLAPPLDVQWVWYLHMVSPANYVNDCIRLIGNAPSHSLKPDIVQEKALAYTKELWNTTYNSEKEPFDVDLSASCVSCHQYKHKLPHDFYQLSRKQRNFHYQVSLPHYHDERFLNEATERYVTHLSLQMRNASVCLSLPVDVQLIMHTHQLSPIFYQYQIGVILGKVMNYEYDCPISCQSAIDKRYKVEAATKLLWEKAGHSYCRPGSAYRGDLPLCIENMTLSNYGTPVEYDVAVTKVELIPMEYFDDYALLFEVTQGNETSKTKIKIEQGFASKHKTKSLSKDQENDMNYIQLEDFSSESKKKSRHDQKVSGFDSLRYSLLSEEKDQKGDDDDNDDVLIIGDGKHSLINYKTNVAHTTSVKISLYEISKNKSKSAKSAIGHCHLDVFKFVGSDDTFFSEGAKKKIILPLEFPSSCPDVRLTLVLSPLQCGHHAFQVSSEDYGLAIFQHIKNALAYPTLMVPFTTLTLRDAPVEVMTYPIKDYRGKQTFSCRVVRSTSDFFYAVEIINKEGVTKATSHLLSKDVLPLKDDLFSSHHKAHFLHDQLQHAMIIRGQKDWGICYGQNLNLSQSGQSFFGLKLFLLHENFNACCYVHKYKGSLYMFTLESTTNRARDAYIYLHLAEGKVVITGNLNEIPEILAFLMSALVLRSIFCEKEKDCWALIDGNGQDLLNIIQSSDDVGLLWDGIYKGDEDCTASYRAVVSKVEC